MRVKTNFENIVKNISFLKNRLNDGVKFCGVVKANAYGHGLVEVSQYIQNDVDFLAVARLEEALALRCGNVCTKILVLNPLKKSEIKTAAKHDISFAVDDEENFDEIAKCGGKIHVKLDTGMNRLGIKEDKAFFDFFDRLKKFGIVPDGVFSHFASSIRKSPEKMFLQFCDFNKKAEILKETYPDIIRHISASDAMYFCPAFQCDMVRSGIFMYGCGAEGLLPCKFASAEVVETKDVCSGESVGYEMKFVAEKDMRIAVVNCGYGDGLPRSYSNGGKFLTKNGFCKVIGNVCMDLTMIEDKTKSLKKGDEVIILGDNGKKSVKADDMAKICDTIPYEIVCNLRNRR